MAGHLRSLLEPTHAPQRHLRDTEYGAAGSRGDALHPSLCLAHQFAQSLFAAYGRQCCTPSRHQLDASPRRHDRRPRRPAPSTPMECQWHLSVPGHALYLCSPFVCRYPPPTRLPHHPLRQSTLGSPRHPRRSARAFRLRSEYRWACRRRTGHLPQRAALRPRRRRTSHL